jgi:hypothetical protein
MSPRERGALPNLVVIGQMKCGTSSLHRYLDLHPEVAMSQLKEPNYFLDVAWGNWDRGVDWYRELFDAAAPVRGEASVNYANLPWSGGAAERMAETLEEPPKLIMMVRDPIDRAISHYIHARAAGREDRPIEAALGDLESRYVRRGLYMTQLRPFTAAFGADAVHVESQEDLLSNRGETMSRIFRFLGVAADFTSPQFERMWEVSAGKDRGFTRAYRLTRRLGGSNVWGRLPTRVRWAGERAFLRASRRGVEGERPMIGPGLRARLEAQFAAEAAGLRRFSGLELREWSV